MKKLLSLLLVSIIVMPLFSVDEERLHRVYESEIRPFIEANTTVGRLKRPDGTVLSYRSMQKPGTDVILIILGGHTESYVKYSELIYDLRDLPMSLYALDQRGQGFSTRTLADREKDHVADYNSYIDDLHSFISEIVKPGADDKVVLLGHSFGAAVAAGFAERHNTAIAGLILSSPYISSKAGPFVLCFLSVIDFFGGAKAYVPGGGPYEAVAFEENKETHSRARHERKLQDYDQYPAIRLGHPTNHWMVEIEKLGREVRKNAAEIVCPTIVFQAEYDEYANPKTQDLFIDGIMNCRSVKLNDSYHELLIETDTIRDEVLMEMGAFMEEHFF